VLTVEFAEIAENRVSGIPRATLGQIFRILPGLCALGVRSYVDTAARVLSRKREVTES